MGNSTDFRWWGTPSGDDEDRSVRNVLLLFAVSLVVIGVGGLVAVLLRHQGSSSDQASSADAAPIGPQPGEELSIYIPARAAALAAAKGTITAVVSFGQYTSEAQARATVGQAKVSALLAAAPGGTPSEVTGPMAAWVDAQIGDNRSERDEIQKLIPTVDDPQFKTFYIDEVNRLTKLIDSVKPDGPLVFGVVVRAPASTLVTLSKAPGVRLVDPGTSAELKPTTPVVGIRPEETARANDPPTRPV